MKKAILVVNSVVASAVITLLVAAGALLVLMFSTDANEFGRKTGLFGSVFFESREVREGVTGASMGVANPIALGVLFVLFAILATVFQLMLRALSEYRAELLAEQGRR